MAKHVRDLSEAEVLALAISLEEDDGRLYGDLADSARERTPASAAVFDQMRAEESSHRARLIDLYRQRFGDHVPLIRRQHVKGFREDRPLRFGRPRELMAARRHTEITELDAHRLFRSTHDALLVGLAASVGAGISMGFAEALSDDGVLTGRGRPWVRGPIVAGELAAISYIRHRYMNAPFFSAALQVVVGGVLVFLAGLLIGSA